jgi:hypothetical protein
MQQKKFKRSEADQQEGHADLTPIIFVSEKLMNSSRNRKDLSGEAQ